MGWSTSVPTGNTSGVRGETSLPSAAKSSAGVFACFTASCALPVTLHPASSASFFSRSGPPSFTSEARPTTTWCGRTAIEGSLTSSRAKPIIAS